MREFRILAAAMLAVLLAPAAQAALVTSVFNGRVPCQPGGVGQICSSAGVVNRVETWDGVPLDVTLTIPPPEQNGPFPLIVDLHGFAAGKTPSEIDELVPQGYVVLIYSARGQHFSCGFPESRLPDLTLSNPNVCNERGWTRLADARYEVRDTQYLAGVLVDEGLVLPDIGVTGISFGGGQSLEHAVLRNRTMLPDGSLVPWQSPGGVPMSIAAAAPMIGWSDLASALAPNGRTLDYRALNPYGTRGGVMKKSWVDALYTAGVPTAFYAPAGADPDADIEAWKARLRASWGRQRATGSRGARRPASARPTRSAWATRCRRTAAGASRPNPSRAGPAHVRRPASSRRRGRRRRAPRTARRRRSRRTGPRWRGPGRRG